MAVHLEIPAPAAAPDAGRVPLAVWRHLDWRLLLPGEPGRMLFVGALDPLAAAALRAVTGQLSVQPPERFRAAPARRVGEQDVVVLAVGAAPSAHDLSLAYDRLRPGGRVVMLVRRPVTRPSRRTPARIRRAARRLAFRDVAVHWLAPSLDACSYIVPLEDRDAIRVMLGRHQGVRFGRLKSLAARALLAAGAIELLARDTIIVAARTGEVPA